MSSIITKSYPRAALIGNPSDGYYGKTIAFLFSNFSAQVTLSESDFLEIHTPDSEKKGHTSLSSFRDEIENYGYYGGQRLIKAAIKVFLDHCTKQNIHLDQKLFSIHYKTDIPRSLGLAGSSALITATMRSLMKYYKVTILYEQLANLVLASESQELGLSAGLQDRVVQAFGSCVYMDFDKDHMDEYGFGRYKPIDVQLLPSLYIAYKKANSESSEVVHNDLRVRYNRGDQNAVDGINRLSDITDDFYSSLKSKNYNALHELINENFDIRRSMLNISKSNMEMIDEARSCGVSAKFTGSGGSIIGTYRSDDQLNKLIANMEVIGAEVFIPKVVSI